MALGIFLVVTLDLDREVHYSLIFVLVVEYFTIILKKAILRRTISIPQRKGLPISDLIYADNLLVFCKVTV